MGIFLLRQMIMLNTAHAVVTKINIIHIFFTYFSFPSCRFFITDRITEAEPDAVSGSASGLYFQDSSFCLSTSSAKKPLLAISSS